MLSENSYGSGVSPPTIDPLLDRIARLEERLGGLMGNADTIHNRLNDVGAMLDEAEARLMKLREAAADARLAPPSGRPASNYR